MTAPRRMGTETSETRRLLLDTAERLMIQEGYAAVGVRRVAREAGVTPALVLYYFRTLDDLFLAMLRRRAEQELERQARALDSPHPLRTLWEISSNPGGALLTEFIALGNHRKSLRAELAAHSERYRTAQFEALAEKVTGDALGLPGTSPTALIVLITAVARILMMEKAMGLTTGHAETIELVEQLLRKVEAAPAPEPGGEHQPNN